MDSNSIKERALAEIAKERAEAEKATRIAQLEHERIEREARIIELAEKQQALLRAERLEAEQAAARAAASEQTALQAEIARLKARTPLEILQDEVADLKKDFDMRLNSELDMHFKIFHEEMAAASAEIVALKNQLETLLSGQFIIRPADGSKLALWRGGMDLTTTFHHSINGPSCDFQYDKKKGLCLWTFERV